MTRALDLNIYNFAFQMSQSIQELKVPKKILHENRPRNLTLLRYILGVNMVSPLRTFRLLSIPSHQRY